MTSIPEIVGLLHDYAPTRLEELRQRFGERMAQDLLTPGVTLGEAEPSVDSRLGQVMCEAALAAMKTAAEKIEPVQQRTLFRLKRAQFWENVGVLIGVVGTSTALAVLWPQAPDPTVAYWASAIGLIGSLVVLAPKLLRKPLLGTSENVATLLIELQDIASRASQLAPMLQYAALNPEVLAAADVKQGIVDANDLARRAHLRLLELA